jgi:V/A-type H+-transporting ATPase subunit K
MRTRTQTLFLLISVSGFIAVAATILFWLMPAQAAEVVDSPVLPPEVLKWGFLAAALATGMSSLGAGFAVATVGSAAIGALAEKPELLGRALIMVGLAEGIAIYGLIISILILNQII